MRSYFFTTKTSKVLIAAIVVFIVAVAGLFFISQQINVIGNELTENTKLIKRQQELVGEYGRLSGLLDRTADQRAELSDLVLSGDDNEIITFLSYLDSLAEQVGVHLQSDSLNIIENKESSFDSLKLQILLDGPSKQVVYMLKLLENLPYHSRVSEITFIRPENESSTKVTLSLLVTVRSD